MTGMSAGPLTLDATFGDWGRVTSRFFSQVSAIALDASGRIVVGGSRPRGSYADFAIARYKPDGSLDGAFGGGGQVSIEFPMLGSVNRCHAVAIDREGRIVAAGSTEASGHDDFAVARLKPDGRLDETFGWHGLVSTDLSGQDKDDVARAIAIDDDGRIILAGYAASRFALACYGPDGSLTPTFGAGGLVTTAFGEGSYDIANAVVIGSAGRIVAVGETDAAGTMDFALARYTPDGTLDATFGTDGRVTTDFSGGESYDKAYAMALDADSRIIAAGVTSPDHEFDFALARYAPDGRLDSSFGAGGLATTHLSGPAGQDEAHALVVSADGRIVVAGTSIESDEGVLGSTYLSLVRYDSHGRLDEGFGTGGVAATAIAGNYPEVALDDEARILLAAATEDGLVLARYLTA